MRLLNFEGVFWVEMIIFSSHTSSVFGFTNTKPLLEAFSILSSLCCNFIAFCRPLPDYSKGFGGKFGVQKDRQDKSAAGWDHIEKVEKHESQKGTQI